MTKIEDNKLIKAKLVKEIEILRNKEEELQKKLNVLDKKKTNNKKYEKINFSSYYFISIE